jgi:acetoacetyl-CoA synthetase
MVTVTKAYAHDFEKIYPLLLELNNPRISKETWQRIFLSHWHSDQDYVGFVLVDQEEILGFMSTIFSKRLIDGQPHNFCNLSSWIVKEQARSKSLLLVAPVLSLKNYTFTMVTLATRLELLWEKFGFKRLNSEYKLLLPLPGISLGFGQSPITFDSNIIEGQLTSDELTIFRDHGDYNCIFALIKSDGAKCFIVFRRITRKGLPFAYIHYISNPTVFTETINKLRLKIVRKLKVVGIIVQDRYFTQNNIFGAINLSSNKCYNEFYKSDLLEPRQIDDLYSELVLLDV